MYFTLLLDHSSFPPVSWSLYTSRSILLSGMSSFHFSISLVCECYIQESGPEGIFSNKRRIKR